MKTMIYNIRFGINSIRWAIFCKIHKRYINRLETRLNNDESGAMREFEGLLRVFGFVDEEGNFI